MKPRFWRSFWDAEWVCILIGSLVMAQNAKISVFSFYRFCKKKIVASLASKLIRHFFCWKSSQCTFCRLDQLKIIGVHILKMKVYEGNCSAKTRDHPILANSTHQDIVIKIFDHLEGWVHMASSYEFKMGFKDFIKLKKITFYVCNLIWSENWI